MVQRNNRVYRLTKGQYSPTSREGMRTKSSPQGVIDHPVDPASFALGAGATFVARSVDVDAKHLQETLERAARHKGTAFVEILQNCPVYNDEEWVEIEDKSTRVEVGLLLEHGKPLVFGPKGARKGLRFEHGRPYVVSLRGDEDPVAAGVTVHDESAPSSYAFALAWPHRPDFPLPLGVLRAVEKSRCEEMLAAQIDDARSKPTSAP